MRVSSRKPELTDFTPFALAVADADGVEAFGEASIRDIAEDRPARYMAVYDDELIALAVMGREGTELAVHPDHRGSGWGGELVGHVTATVEPKIWAHGNLPAAARLARAAGLVAGRELVKMQAGFEADQADHGLQLRRPVSDDEIADLNALIFADHPEQGAMTVADVPPRGGEIMIAIEDEKPAGFYWIQRDPAELYVMGVHPAFQGRGLAARLTRAALVDLAGGGAQSVTLFVDGENERAVKAYEKVGFESIRSDIMYVAPDGGE